jgi:dienelactone hydrolase
MVAGIHKYLDRELAASVHRRQQFWKPDYSSAAAYRRSIQPNRARLRKVLGIVDKRSPVKELELVATTSQPALVAHTEGSRVYAVRWPVLPGVDGDGLYLEPKGKAVASVVALPDADWTPEMLAGLTSGIPREAQFARRLAENGCRVLVPALIDRQDTWSGNPRLRMTNEPHREFIYRMAYQMGRHIIGYEVQKVLAAVDWFTGENGHAPVGLYGYGEGGLIALCAAAADDGVLPNLLPRIRATVVSGYFGPREQLWEEPIYRNVWGWLREFGDAELVQLTAYQRELILEYCEVPRVNGPPPERNSRSGAAPGRLWTPSLEAFSAEVRRAKALPGAANLSLVGEMSSAPDTSPGRMVGHLLHALPQSDNVPIAPSGPAPVDVRKGLNAATRQKRQFDQLVAFTQKMLRESEERRQEFFWSKLNTSSPERYQQSAHPLREYLWNEVFGKLPQPALPANPRTRQVYDEPKWTGYEVMLDLYTDVFCYGVLLVPKDLRPGEHRPLVVCQHGLEGRPTDVVDPRKKTVYNAFGARLADRGYIVYAPQNPYIGGNNFRQLQRKANPLKLSMYSFILSQHERTLEWLAGLPFVDAKRLAYYGLSYGGESAVRVPPLLPRYTLSICSADFNYFPWKTLTLDFAASYLLVGTYEIFDFNMNNTFSHAEMAALMAPRPFMVERGHDDGVGLDEWVAYEYAKVRRLYARLNLPERTAIEFFAGGHEIHAQGTFAFLQKHLRFPLEP